MNETIWNIAHASVIGVAHINQETECQDRFSCEVIEVKGEKILIAVVADGAGSTTDGQIGAEVACQLFIDEVSDYLRAADASVGSLNSEFGKLWVLYVQNKINEIAQENGKLIRDFASTFVAAVIGETQSVFYQIGDGGSVYSFSGEPNSYQFAIPPEESEYVNVTNFVTDETATENLRFVLINERIEDLVLFSDGIFAVAVDYQNNKPHEPFLMPMIAPLRNRIGANLNEKLKSFLASPKLNEKTDDDKTLILATRK